MPNASPSVVSAPPTIEILERQAHLGARTAPPVARAVARPRGAMIVAMTMLFVSTLPDAMVVPMLRELLVQRYHISAASAHWFMAVNLLGALLALPLLAWLRRILSPARMLGWAAAADGLLLLSMAGDVGFGATLALRLVEGAADLILLALIFDLVGKAGAAHDRGRRFGIAGTVLLLSLAGGIILGASVGRDDALRVFFISAAGCGVVVIMVTVWRRLVDGLVRSCPAAELVSSALAPARRRLWPSMAMLFGDRAIAGLMVSTVPLFMAGDQRRLLAIPLAMMALLSWPMGRLGDRIGHERLRMLSASVYAIAITGLAAAPNLPTAALVGIMVFVGVAGAALMPTTFALGARAGQGAVGMGRIQAAGHVGYFVGIAGAGQLLGLLDDRLGEVQAYTMVLLVFAAGYIALTAVTTFALRRA